MLGRDATDGGFGGRPEDEVELPEEDCGEDDGQEDEPRHHEVARDDGDGPPSVVAEKSFARRQVIREEAQVMYGVAPRRQKVAVALGVR